MTTAENPTAKVVVTAGTSRRGEHDPEREAPGGLQSSIFWAYADIVGDGLFPLLFEFEAPAVATGSARSWRR